MDINKSIHRKDLIGLGLKNTHLSAIVGHSVLFKNAPKQHGYALSYSYKQAFLLYIGCELYSLGLSFRHVDDILIDISHWEFEEKLSSIKKQKKILIIQRHIYADKYKGYKSTLPKDPFTGKTIVKLDKKRKAPINCEMHLEKEYNTIKDKLSSVIRINLYTIAEVLEDLF